MEIMKMKTNNLGDANHKEIAMAFLLEANGTLEEPLTRDLIEKVYDLFASEQTGQQGYQKQLDVLVNQQEQSL